MWEKLEPILRDVCDDPDYLLGMRTLLPTEENKKEMLDAIDRGFVAKDADEITLYALAIYHDDPFEE
ncbi:MAG TPA: hypothetical protein DDY92_01950 [Dialister sp.]|nr:hypothetical protein [Dialister sp.]